jgi:hypothetical protein
LRKLSFAKLAANKYFLHGRVQRDLPDQQHLPSKSMISMAWLSKDKTSLMLPITTPRKEGTIDVDMTLDLRRYGFNDKDASNKFSVTQIEAYKGQKVEQDHNMYPGDQVKIIKKVPARDVVLLEIK